MSSITIRGCCIGAGRPKVILPIVARTEDDILREARRLSALKADCIEWQAHKAGVTVVCSSHDFHKTPSRTEMVTRLTAMQQAGADLPKLAVMPNSPSDVLELLAATAEMAEQHPETPVITMSMGALGAVSRLCGETFGSAMTFANPGQASAPGQVALDVVNEVLDSLRLE